VTTGPEALTPEQLAEQWEAEKPPPAGPLANLGAAAAVIGVGAAGIVGSLALGIGTLRSPSAGTWPLVVSVVLVVLGLALAAGWRSTADTERFTGSTGVVLVGLATMVAFALLIGTIGFEIPAALLAFVWLKFLGRETWRVAIVGSLAMVVAFYLVFVVALGVSIPHLF
jgi:hypothetical protein